MQRMALDYFQIYAPSGVDERWVQRLSGPLGVQKAVCDDPLSSDPEGQ